MRTFLRTVIDLIKGILGLPVATSEEARRAGEAAAEDKNHYRDA